VARGIERLLGNYGSSRAVSLDSLALLGVPSQNLPHDRERGTLLVDVSEAQRGLASLSLSERVHDAILRLIRENRHADLLRSHGPKPAGKVLYCGSPGCGETVAAEAVARELYLLLVLVGSTRLFLPIWARRP